MYNVYQSLQETATRYPNQTAIMDEYGALSYAELLQTTDQLSVLLRQAGIGQGVFVGLLTDNNRHFIIGLYAAIACDAVVMPIFHKQKTAETNKSIVTAEIEVVLSDENNRWTQEGITAEPVAGDTIFSLTWIQKGIRSEQLARFANPAFVRFTSGTTGLAKGVVISHEAVWDRIEAANTALQISKDDRVLWVFPMAYHFIVSIVLYLRHGATIIINNDFLAEEILDSVTKHEVTFFYCAPMHLKLLGAYPEPRELPSLRYVVSTTTGASYAVCKAFEDKYRLPVHQAFGIIEVGLPMVNTVDASAHPDAVGQALAAYEVSVLDEEGQKLPVDVIGRLGIKGPGMFDGYLQSPHSKIERLENGYFMTGDLAVKDKREVVTIKGREKNVIIVHGNKVFPTEVEEVLNTHTQIHQSRVYGQKHPLFGEVVVADVVASEDLNIETLLSSCRQKLSSYKVPQRVQIVEEIEHTASGKIVREKKMS
ncbi:class I adenylate-forming enzyme family protein [Reichenbachiella sp. MSK19-1]|uniref:class I adenylate-forming enzyme family protein n=1 Tax=Reichenbachiella sp. MSK19-1 TaxID=1897631 RepID=UPI000E6BAF03|nr:class I adenylate-forming enzyme family protein [Reichenbachiella sp. MSK19-1]RJE71969.1 hypothetical protein BGP76_07770 [Reichenbachiella sp. MSK19-1]